MLNIQNYSASPHPGIVAERPQTPSASEHVETAVVPSTTEHRGTDIISLSQAATKIQQAQQTLQSTPPISEENNDERTLARQQLTSSLNALASLACHYPQNKMRTCGARFLRRRRPYLALRLWRSREQPFLMLRFGIWFPKIYRR